MPLTRKHLTPSPARAPARFTPVSYTHLPDLICTLDASTGEAISTAEAKDGMEAYAIVIPKEKLILGAGMHQRELFQEVEDLLHKDMVACNDGLFV